MPGTTPDTAPATAPDDVRRSLGVELGRHARLLHVVKAHLAGHAPTGLDFAALSLLLNLTRGGPRRQGELAEAALLDPSTTSRYVAQLVRGDLVARQAHPDDGRAVVLAATARGERVAADMIRHRDALIGTAVAGWPAEDVATLTTLLCRLNDELEHIRPTARSAETTTPEREH